MTETNQVIHGDCMDVMREMEANSIDTIITDPPYHLGSISKRFTKTSLGDDNDTAANARNGSNQYARLSTGFMGKSWDGGGIAFLPELWAEMLRVAKPGATLLAFGGTRTHHRLMVAIEDAGWEIRDCLMWLYGSGFPKSHNISKAIDRAEGKEREVVGKSNRHNGRAFGSGAGDPDYRTYKGGVPNITAPATEAAKTFDGFGTGLKPAVEPIIYAQKPIEKTYANNAQVWGVAGLNIDGARIGTGDNLGRVSTGLRSMHDKVFENGARPKSYYGEQESRLFDNSGNKGRWPANVLMSHSEGCVRRGERKIKGSDRPGHDGKSSTANLFNKKPHMHSNTRHADPNGLETVADWECVDGGEVSMSLFSHKNAVLLPAAGLFHVQDFVLNVLDELSDYSKRHNIHGNHVFDNSYIEGKLSTEGALFDAMLYELQWSKLPNFRVGCQFCRRFYDEQLHRVLVSSQDESPSRLDVLYSVYSDLCLFLYNLLHQYPAPLSSLDDFLPSCGYDDILKNNIFEGGYGLSEDETLSRIQDRFDLIKSAKNPNNIAECNIFESFSEDEIYSHIEHIQIGFHLLSWYSLDIASKVLPSKLLQRYNYTLELSSCPIRILDEQAGVRKSGKILPHHNGHGWTSANSNVGWKRESHNEYTQSNSSYGDSGSASRFFYTAKAPNREKWFYCQLCAQAYPNKERDNHGHDIPQGQRKHIVAHPTTKPLTIMKYLATLTRTPTGGIVLDPFAGSGTTALACIETGRDFILIEKESDYYEIAKARVAAARKEPRQAELF